MEPTYEITEKRTVTVAEIYGRPFSELVAPEEWEFTGRLVKVNEVPPETPVLLTTDDKCHRWKGPASACCDIVHGIRLELRPKPKTKRMYFEVPQGTELELMRASYRVGLITYYAPVKEA